MKILFFLLLSATSFADYRYRFSDQRKYEDIKKIMIDVAARAKVPAQLFVVGNSDSGDFVGGIKLGDGPVKHLVVATHHGNEYGSTEVALALMSSLSEVAIPGITVIVVPVLNISGYNQRYRYEAVGGRYYDPNRDYPGPCGTEGPFRLKSTTGLAELIQKENVVASATLHTYYPAVLYPWGISTYDTSTPYDDLFINLGKLSTIESGYTVGNSTNVLYPADGTFEDYAFWKHGVWSLLFELGHSHSPNANDVAKLLRVNIPGLRRMLEAAPRVRAPEHEFKGQCDSYLKFFDLHQE